MFWKKVLNNILELKLLAQLVGCGWQNLGLMLDVFQLSTSTYLNKKKKLIYFGNEKNKKKY